jgi:hypothetical protein
VQTGETAEARAWQDAEGEERRGGETRKGKVQRDPNNLFIYLPPKKPAKPGPRVRVSNGCLMLTRTRTRLTHTRIPARVSKPVTCTTGASHHMSPCREDFITYHEIQPKVLSAANKEYFMAYGTGDIIISVPAEKKANPIRLTGVLYTPATAFTLISIGKIDDAGYYVTFGGGACEINNAKGDLIG